MDLCNCHHQHNEVTEIYITKKTLLLLYSESMPQEHTPTFCQERLPTAFLEFHKYYSTCGVENKSCLLSGFLWIRSCYCTSQFTFLLWNAITRWIFLRLVTFASLFYFLSLSLRQYLSVYPWLSWNMLCRTGWQQTHNSPVCPSHSPPPNLIIWLAGVSWLALLFACLFCFVLIQSLSSGFHWTCDPLILVL